MYKKSWKRMNVCWLVLVAFAVSGLGALEDNAPARYEYRQVLSNGVTSEDLESRIVNVNKNGAQGRVRFQFSQQEGKFYYFFSNELGRQFPLYSTGSYIIRKDAAGEIDQIKIFLLHRDDSFIRLLCDKGQTLVSVELMGKAVYQRIYLPKALSYFALAPLAELKGLLFSSLDLGLLFPRYQLVNTDVVAMRNQIRLHLNGFPEVYDGAMNEQGSFVHIADNSPQSEPYGFNCSGFAKWITDGIYEPATGSLLSLDRLKRRLLQARGSEATLPYERSRDLFFGLDWTRNIASVLAAMDQEKEISDLESEAQDVMKLPFLTHIEDRGFAINDLELALYLLAVNNPGNFYFGSVSRAMGRDPILVQHHHVTVLFPWIDEYGFFRVSVMDINAEVSLANLKARYGNALVNLVKVRAAKNFKLRPVSGSLEKVKESTGLYL